MNFKENDSSKKNIYNIYFNLLWLEFGMWEVGGIMDNFFMCEMIVN